MFLRPCIIHTALIGVCKDRAMRQSLKGIGAAPLSKTATIATWRVLGFLSNESVGMRSNTVIDYVMDNTS
jgi:hypothetical protein